MNRTANKQQTESTYNETLPFKLAMCALILIVGSPILYGFIYVLALGFNVLKDIAIN